MKPFDLQRMLLDDLPLGFLGEVALRVLIIFLVVVFSLRLMGKRGVKQLSIFEIVIILTLGSAAGDISFYEDVPLLPVLVVFVIVISLYKIVTALIEKNEKLEKFLEGEPLIILRDGMFVSESFEKENISFDEFFMELRLKGVEHLGQVRLAIVEVNGDVSTYFFTEKDTRYGLSILPGSRRFSVKKIPTDGYYSCCRCGNTQEFSAGQSKVCAECKHSAWVPSINIPKL